MEQDESETVKDLIEEAERLCEKLRTAVAENEALPSEARVEVATLRKHIRTVRQRMSRNVKPPNQVSLARV